MTGKSAAKGHKIMLLMDGQNREDEFQNCGKLLDKSD